MIGPTAEHLRREGPMNTTALAVSNFEPVVRLVVDSLTSPHSQRAYE